MIGTLSFAGILVQVLLSVIVVAATAVYLRRKERIGLRPVLIGALVFVLFTQILEKGLHVYMLQMNSATAALLKQAWLYGIYGSLAAGLFEELGRYVAFRWWLKGRRSWGDGLAYGLGHGGIEALLIGVVGGIQTFMLALMYNNGTLQQTLGAKLPPQVAEGLIAGLVHTPFYMYMLGAFERIPALLVQLALSIMVLQGVRTGRFRYVLYAILLHAAVDFVPALYQAKAISIFAAEAVILIAGIAGFMYLRHMKMTHSREWSPE